MLHWLLILCIKLEDPSQPISNPNASIMNSGYRKEVLNLLMRPYDDEEYQKLWKDIKMPCSSINRRGTSLLSLHKGRLTTLSLFSSTAASLCILNASLRVWIFLRPCLGFKLYVVTFKIVSNSIELMLSHFREFKNSSLSSSFASKWTELASKCLPIWLRKSYFFFVISHLRVLWTSQKGGEMKKKFRTQTIK